MADATYHPTPKERFWAAVGAQVAGILLFLFIGNVFPVSHTELSEGLSWIHTMAYIAFGALVVSLILGRLAKRWCKDFDSCVDKVISVLLIFDIPIVLFLVCQQGGLSRSMFVPLFFLIPVAQLAVEQRGKRYRVYIGVFFIAVSLVISCLVSQGISPQNPTLKMFGLGSVPITDFSTLAVNRYATAILIVSLISLAIPLLQWGIVEFLADEKQNIALPSDEQPVKSQQASGTGSS
jgi:hypothetical protein